VPGIGPAVGIDRQHPVDAVGYVFFGQHGAGAPGFYVAAYRHRVETVEPERRDQRFGVLGRLGHRNHRLRVGQRHATPKPDRRAVRGDPLKPLRVQRHIFARRIDQLDRDGAEIRGIRGEEIAMIFQDPMTALNPVYTVGYQIAEALHYHTDLNAPARRRRVVELLTDMGIPLPEKRADEFPHQFSGGMRQRAMIAMAMSCNPKILIADEPTTALDVTIQAQIFSLMNKLKEDNGTAIMLITHDMGVIAELADDVAVMYMGNIVEAGTVDDVLRRPRHPYTRGLLDSIPVLGRGRDQEIMSIRGATPDAYDRPKGCQFAPRCDFATDACNVMPDEDALSDTHRVRCHHPQKVAAHV